MRTIHKFFAITILLISEILYASGNTGGMDGGGGGTLPAQPASVYQVQEIATEAKPTLLYLFNGYEWREKYDQNNSLYKKLFDGPRKVQEVLKDLRLEVRLDKPCYTSAGTEVDGSIYGIKDLSICLSAQRISQKVDRAVAEREVIALLMHEVSHFMGATEAEATELQQDTSWWILNSKPDAGLDGDRIRRDLDRFESHLDSVLEGIEAGDLSLVGKRLAESLGMLSQWESLTNSSPYKLFESREEQYQDLLRYQLIWANNYVESLIPGADQAWAIEQYNKVFNGREYFIAHEEFALDKDHFYRDEKIHRLKSVLTLKDLVSAIKSEYEIRSAYTYQVTFGMQWLRLDGHLTVPQINPWEKFVGQYQVQSVQCDVPSNREDEVGFAVEMTPAGLFLRQIFSSASSANRIEFGAYNLNAYLNEFGETNDGGVYMIHEMGGTWSDRIYTDLRTENVRLTKTSGSTFRMDRTTKVLRKDVTKPDFIRNCVIEGSYQ